MELVLTFTWFILGGLPQVLCNPDAKRLYDDLLSNYNRLIRPVGNNSDRLTVKMGLRLSQLIDVVNKLIITNCVQRLKTINHKSASITPKMDVLCVKKVKGFLVALVTFTYFR